MLTTGEQGWRRERGILPTLALVTWVAVVTAVAPAIAVGAWAAAAGEQAMAQVPWKLLLVPHLLPFLPSTGQCLIWHSLSAEHNSTLLPQIYYCTCHGKDSWGKRDMLVTHSKSVPGAYGLDAPFPPFHFVFTLYNF